MARQDIDLNIWDTLAYKSSGTEYGEWKIDIYHDIQNHGSPDQIIYLNATQVEMLGLNRDEVDFWSDPVSFLHQNKNVPRKVRRILENLEEAA